MDILILESEIFEDLRTMINRHIKHVFDELSEESFDKGEITVKLILGSREEFAADGSSVYKAPTIDYKVSTALKHQFSEDNGFFFNNHIIEKQKDGNYALRRFTGNQIDMLEDNR